MSKPESFYFLVRLDSDGVPDHHTQEQTRDSLMHELANRCGAMMGIGKFSVSWSSGTPTHLKFPDFPELPKFPDFPKFPDCGELKDYIRRSEDRAKSAPDGLRAFFTPKRVWTLYLVFVLLNLALWVPVFWMLLKKRGS